MPCPYERSIKVLSDKDPRHIEAWLRAKFGTLDHLDSDQFKEEVELAEMCIEGAGEAESEALANSFGLRR